MKRETWDILVSIVAAQLLATSTAKEAWSDVPDHIPNAIKVARELVNTAQDLSVDDTEIEAI